MARSGRFGASALFAAFISFLFAFPFLSCSRLENDEFRPYDKDYSLSELQMIENSSFRPLNHIDYDGIAPDGEISESYKSAVENFSGMVYRLLAQDGLFSMKSGENFAFSPLGLYELLAICALGVEDGEALAALDSALGMTRQERKADFIKSYKNDFISNGHGTLQMYNASFLTNSFRANQAYVDELTAHYAECYQMDFTNAEDIGQLLSWIGQRVREEGFLTAEDLGLPNEETVACLFSTLYFNNKWLNVFSSSDSFKDSFAGRSGKAEFMRHSYLGEAHDCGRYVTCYDYYRNGMKVKYFICKDNGDDLLSVLEGADLFHDDPDKAMARDQDGEWSELVINLSVPKFEAESKADFIPVLEKMGLARLFDAGANSFGRMFTSLPDGARTHLTVVKQKNKISFDEDGTTIRTVTWAQMDGATSPGKMKTVDIKLDSPFLYIIYDANDLPLLIGSVVNP